MSKSQSDCSCRGNALHNLASWPVFWLRQRSIFANFFHIIYLERDFRSTSIILLLSFTVNGKHDSLLAFFVPYTMLLTSLIVFSHYDDPIILITQVLPHSARHVVVLHIVFKSIHINPSPGLRSWSHFKKSTRHPIQSLCSDLRVNYMCHQAGTFII
jgi:hypothetical protein